MTLARPQATQKKTLQMKAAIVLIAALIHSIFFLFLVIGSPQITKKKNQKLIVKTFQKSAPQKVLEKKPVASKTVSPTTHQKNDATTKSQTQKSNVDTTPSKTAPIKKQTTEKPIVKAKDKPSSPQKSEAKKNTLAKEYKHETSAIPDSLLKELEGKIENLQQNKITPSKTKEIAIPQLAASSSKVNTSHFNEELDSELTGNFIEALISFLHSELHLPDYGEVKMQITISKNGAIQKAIVIKAESEKNKKYLQEMLPQLLIPEFLMLRREKGEQTYTLTFCNEI